MSAVRTRALRALLADHDGVVSFDVFDTLLWRRYPRPIDVFHDIPRFSQQLDLGLPAVDGASFAMARRQAESAARAWAVTELGSPEVTMTQVHEHLALALGWDVGDAQLLINLETAELAAEAAALVADHELLRLVDELAERTTRMVVISDSYLSNDQVMQLVVGAGYPAAAFERAFASSSFGVSKSCGLFEIVVKELDLLPTQLIHVGDLPGADVTPVRELGGRSVRWPVARDEAITLVEAEAGTSSLPMRTTPVNGQVTAGDAGITALRARLIVPDDLTDVRERTLTGYERFGRLIYGPVVVGLCNWICMRAAEAGLRELYFFQREGRLLAELASRIADHRDQPLTPRILSVSRAALAPARHKDVTVGYLADLLLGRRPRRASEVISELGLDPADIPSWTLDRRVTSRDAAELFDQLKLDGRLMEHVGDDLDRRRTALLRYLAGAVDLEVDELAVVDLGWASTIQGLLSTALTQVGFSGRIRGFYLATNAGAQRNLSAGSRVESFVAHLGMPEEMGPVFRNPELIEQACLERIGSVIGYDDDGAPTRAHDDIDPHQWNAIAKVQDGVRAFLEEWIIHERSDGSVDAASSIEVWRHAARQSLVRFCAHPSRQEIELFRSWRHDDNKGARSVETLVPAIFEERTLASAMLADVLHMDELLWASAVATLNGGEVESQPVSVEATISDAGQAATLPPVTAVGAVSDGVIAAYVGGEATRLASVRIGIACGPAVVRLRRVSVEIESADSTITERLSTFRQLKVGWGSQAVAADLAIVKSRTLRLTVPLTAMASRLASGQRLRVLVELQIDPFIRTRSKVVEDAVVRGRGIVRMSAARVVPQAARFVQATGGERLVRQVVEEISRSPVGRSIFRR